MSKVCHKKGPGNSFYELDIYSDMNMAIDKDCPAGWNEGKATKDCKDVDQLMSCYKCDGNMRQTTLSCIPPDVKAKCGKGYDNYPIKCNYPSANDLQPYNPKTYSVNYCPCQEMDGTVTGYSPLCCPNNQAPTMPTGPQVQPISAINPPQPMTAGVSGKIPWYGWILVSGLLVYFINQQGKKTVK